MANDKLTRKALEDYLEGTPQEDGTKNGARHIDGGMWDVAVPINRTNAVPLDNSTIVFQQEADKTVEEAAIRATLDTNTYPGQIITVIHKEGDGATSFVVQTNTHTRSTLTLNEDSETAEATPSFVVEQIAYQATLDKKIVELKKEIGNLVHVMNFRGVYASLDAVENEADSQDRPNAEDLNRGVKLRPGDVVVIAGGPEDGTEYDSDGDQLDNRGKPGMEYVYTGNGETHSWAELGFGSQVTSFLGGDKGLSLPTTLPNGNPATSSTVLEYIQESDKAITDRLDNLVLDTNTVFMGDDLKFTINFGKYTTTNNKPYIISKFKNGKDGEVKSLHDLFTDAFSKILYPKTNYPTASFSANGHTTDTGTNEIGSYVKAIKWKSSSDNGSYVGANGIGTYGSSGGTSNASGISSSDFSWAVTNNKVKMPSPSPGTNGTFTFSEALYKDSTYGLQINSTSSKTYATLDCITTLDPSKAYTPKDNTGELYEAGKIKGFDEAGTTTITFKNVAINVTGFRNSWYYVGTDCTTAINSAFIRKATPKNANTTNFGTITIPAGTKRIMIAIPGTHVLKSVIDVDGQNLDVKANFTAETIAVEGANGFTATNYTVFHFENENGIAATKYTFSIS